jgi:hypothetical protein
MILHCVLFTPRADLGEPGRRALAEAFAQAVRAIPSVRGARVGPRTRHGADYERASGAAEFLVVLEFDSLEGLQAYLAHPAHEGLGRHFRESLALADVYDFDVSGMDDLERLL